MFTAAKGICFLLAGAAVSAYGLCIPGIYHGIIFTAAGGFSLGAGINFLIDYQNRAHGGKEPNDH